MKKVLLLLLVIIFQGAYAQDFNFNLKGDKTSNLILKNHIQKNFDLDDIDVISYFYDIDQDNKKDIIGIVKSNVFYTLEGYKLIVLKKESEDYKPLKCDIFFDNTREITFENNKITYYKTIFYKNKKYSAYLKNNEIKTIKLLKDKLTDKKVQNIEQLTRHVKNENVNYIELTDFKTKPEKNVNINYKNLSDRTKHYLYMK